MTASTSPSPTPTATVTPAPNPVWRRSAIITLVALITVCVLWETVVAPLRPGGSWMTLKVLPLLLPLRGILRGNLYTYQWASMLSLVYVMEGAVRAFSDPSGISVAMAWLELILASAFFVSAVAYVMPAKRAYKARKKAAGTTKP